MAPFRKNDMQEKLSQYDFKLNETNQRIRQFESDEKGHSHRREYLGLEKKVCVYMLYYFTIKVLIGKLSVLVGPEPSPRDAGNRRRAGYCRA